MDTITLGRGEYAVHVGKRDGVFFLKLARLESPSDSGKLIDKETPVLDDGINFDFVDIKGLRALQKGLSRIEKQMDRPDNFLSWVLVNDGNSGEWHEKRS